ncbi:hypothetical protein GQ54DRAFT_249154, partial [Martensiomyces pterosporus]
WSMTQMPAEERAHACQEQVSFCYNVCGAVASTEKNFCNIRTMGWNCVCNGKSTYERDFPEHEWPIAIAECRAALGSCNDGCASQANPNEKIRCLTTCTTDYQCSTSEAPRS